MIVIGIGNKARHGKDTAASAILNYAEAIGYATLKMSWADALREEVRQSFLSSENGYWEFRESQIQQPLVSFWSRVKRTETFEECWEWQGKKNEKGYGIVYTPEKENYRAHLFMWKEVLGLSLDNEEILRHKCDNRVCVNPAHLLPGTSADNSTDMVKRGRSARGENHSQASLTDAQISEIKASYALGKSQTELAQKFNSSSATISRLINGKTRQASVSVPLQKEKIPSEWSEILSKYKYLFATTLQLHGTEYRRKQDTNYWVKKGLEKIRAFEKENPYCVVVVPDTRFPNEAEAIKSLGGDTLNITRLNKDNRSPFRSPDRPADHPSEIQLDEYGWDYRITVGDNQVALVGEMAITIFEYIRSLKGA